MKTIFPLSLFALIFAALPIDASLTVSEGVKLQGSILSVKSTKKYTSVSGCKAPVSYTHLTLPTKRIV